MTLKIKSLKETTEKADGLRILIARYRPRALPKSKENWNEWWKDLAPSKALHRDYMKDKIIDRHEYKRRFLIEIINNPEALLCHCYNVDDHCHRYLIRDMI